MNKSELVQHVAGAAGLDQKAAASAVDAVLDGIVATVKGGERVSLLGFGAFSPTARAARMGRNPQTGAPVKIAASKGVRFAPGAPFKAALNTRGSAKKAASAKATTKRAQPAKAVLNTRGTAKKAASAKAAKAARKK